MKKSNPWIKYIEGEEPDTLNDGAWTSEKVWILAYGWLPLVAVYVFEPSALFRETGWHWMHGVGKFRDKVTYWRKK